jgi:excisionase family DNA binding protein
MPEDTAGVLAEQVLAILRSPQLAEILRPASPWMSPEDTAQYLGIALGTLRNWTSAHFVPHAKKGRVVRYHRDTIDKWLAKGGCSGRSSLADTSD